MLVTDVLSPRLTICPMHNVGAKGGFRPKFPCEHIHHINRHKTFIRGNTTQVTNIAKLKLILMLMLSKYVHSTPVLLNKFIANL